MKSIFLRSMVILSSTIILTACGGGGDRDDTVRFKSPIPGGAVGERTVPETQRPPAAKADATTLSGENINTSISGGDFVIQFAGSTNVTFGGSTSTVTFAQNQVAGNVSIVGSGNNIVFKPGATVVNLTVTGSANTIWIPVGSKIVVANASSAVAGLNSSTVYIP